MADSSQLIILLILEWVSNLKHLSHLFRKYSVSKFGKKKKCVVFNLAFDFDHLSAWEWVSKSPFEAFKMSLIFCLFCKYSASNVEKRKLGDINKVNIQQIFY